MHSTGTNHGMKNLAATIVRSALALAVLSALLLVTAHSAQAQTETVLHSFNLNTDDAGDPISNLTWDAAGNLYGVAAGGFYGFGAIYELSPDGSGGWTESVFYSFSNNFWSATGPLFFDSLGNLYGTAATAGPNGGGVVFELSPSGGTWTESVVYGFSAGSNNSPLNGVIMDSAGNLYGENSSGVFELTQSGGIWTEKLILPAAIFTDGGSGSGLTTVGGNIYGIGSGKVFELSPRSGGGWKAKVIHEFAISGTNAEGTLIADAAGNLYGTTAGGGLGFGTVYKLTLETTGKWKITVLYAFKNNGTDGENPWGGVVLDSAGNLYGTTQNGGTSGYGTVFELSPPQAGKTAYTEKVLWEFNLADGQTPYSSLVRDSAGNLYGNTRLGGLFGYGTVFEVTP
jgi:uncharacterized repeat protein (TIGR03803 family)